MCEIPLFSQKVMNYEEINCGPLSETIDLGIPCRLNISLRARIVHDDVMLFIFSTSGNILYASTITKYMFSFTCNQYECMSKVHWETPMDDMVTYLVSYAWTDILNSCSQLSQWIRPCLTTTRMT